MPKTLQPYSGTFGEAEAWHLLRRCTYAPTLTRVKEAVRDGLAQTLDRLLDYDADYGPPLNNDTEIRDPNVGFGESWILAPYSRTIDLFPYRYRSLSSWVLEGMYRSGDTVNAKMWMFWINHFGVEISGDQRSSYQYFLRLRQHGLGSYRQLIQDVALEPQMLRFLNGESNSAASPNENFARELLELYTLGKGPQTGPGDYTTFTEQDVRAFARALTGYGTRHQFSDRTDVQPTVEFRSDRHDAEPKQLSHRFANAVLTPTGVDELGQAIDLVFAQPTAGDYLARKLYRYFVHYDVDAAAEMGAVLPLGQVLRESDFEMKPVLARLLGSEAFFDSDARGALIKSPMEYSVGLHRGLGFVMPDDIVLRYRLMQRTQWMLYDQRMLPFEPPSVAGWKAYYQAPLYNRYWISSATLQNRMGNVWNWVYNGLKVDQDTLYAPSLLDYVAALDNPADPNDLIADLAQRHLPMPLTDGQSAALKAMLIPGLPDFEWTIEYDAFRDAPDNEGLRMAIERKLRNVLVALYGSSEYNLF